MSEAVSNLLEVLSDPFFGTLSPMVIAARAELAALQSENQRLQGEVESHLTRLQSAREFIAHLSNETCVTDNSCGRCQSCKARAFVSNTMVKAAMRTICTPSEQREEKI